MIGELLWGLLQKRARIYWYCFCVTVLMGTSIGTGWGQQAYPDLTVSSVSGPSKAGPGQQITVTFTIRNDGPVDVTCGNDFRVGIYLSPDGAISTNDILLPGKVTVCGINAGALSTVPALVTIPSNLVNGTYYIGAIVDVDGNVTESNEMNNSLAGNQITISNLPDIVITSVTAPANGFTYGSINVPVTLANIGYSNAFVADVYFYLSSTPQLTPQSICINPQPYFSCIPYAVGATLAPGDSLTLLPVPSLFIPNDFTPGTYYVIAKVTGGTESDPTNNTLAAPLPVTIFGPDVAMVSVSGPSSAHNGDTISISNSIATKGLPGGTVCDEGGCGWGAGSISVQFGLFRYRTDTVPFATLWPSRAVTIGAGETNTDNTSTMIYSVSPGTYYLGATALSTACNIYDECSPSDETDTTNNVLIGNQIVIQ